LREIYTPRQRLAREREESEEKKKLKMEGEGRNGEENGREKGTG